MRVVSDSSIPLVEKLFSEPYFKVSTCSNINPDTIRGADILLCRSYTEVNEALLKGSMISCVGSATSGLNHIDTDYLISNNISLFHAKGANAQSVCDYVQSVIASQQLSGANSSAGVIGVGHVGKKVAQMLSRESFKVFLNDPIRNINEDDFNHTPLNELSKCDVITIHTPLINEGCYKTKQLLNADFLSKLKPETLVINSARGEVLDEKYLFMNKNKLRFCLDVFENEPMINPDVIKKTTISTPHIAGHAIEAKQRATLMLYTKICQHYNIESTIADNLKTLLESNTPSVNFKKALSIYNPLIETKYLKEMNDASAFTKLRNKHLHRHEFHLA